MKKYSMILSLIGILIIAGVFFILKKNNSNNPQPNPSNQTNTNQEPQPLEIIVNYNPVVKFEPQTTRMQEGSEVVIHATSAAADELHLHGYDLYTDLEPAIMGEIKFTADKTGRFEFELEGGKIVLGVIEVYPK